MRSASRLGPLSVVVAAAVACAVTVVACVTTSTLGGTCGADSDCDADQQCELKGNTGTCVPSRVQRTADAGPLVDAGSIVDAGFVHDAGFRLDAGALQDAGFEIDAGLPGDAGILHDAGVADPRVRHGSFSMQQMLSLAIQEKNDLRPSFVLFLISGEGMKTDGTVDLDAQGDWDFAFGDGSTVLEIEWLFDGAAKHRATTFAGASEHSIPETGLIDSPFFASHYSNQAQCGTSDGTINYSYNFSFASPNIDVLMGSTNSQFVDFDGASGTIVNDCH